MFWIDFNESAQYKICEKSIQCESSCAMQVDGWTDMTNMIVNFTTSECSYICLFKLKLGLCIFDLQIPYVVCMVVCIPCLCVLSFLLFLMLRLLSDSSY
jgi:hypothetical protein